ncbi:MAG: hypothetical protein V4757_02190 [Pseudomonadota bacterium]
MRILSPTVENALASGKAAFVQFIKLAWPSGTQGFNAGTWTIPYGGVDYRGAAGLGAVAAVVDKPGELQGMEFEIGGVDDALMALALDDADQVQDAPINVFTAIMDGGTLQILDVQPDWAGYGDTMIIVEDGVQSSVRLTAEHKGVDLLRGNPSSYSDADQQVLHPGDRCFEYVVDQADKPVVWPERAWYFK